MTALRLEAFTGIVPRLSKRLLPNSAAAEAENVKLLSGEIRGYRTPRLLADFSDVGYTVLKAYRAEYDLGAGLTSRWLTFPTRDVDVVRSPIVNDLYKRYYWAGDGKPKYTTAARLDSAAAPLLLGVPTPVSAPVVTPTAGTALTRAYVYTFASSMGEEGPPSPPTIATGVAGTWTISGMDSSVPLAAQRDIATIKIYRTVAGQASTSFFFVGSVPLGTTTFNDNIADDFVALNNLLESTTYLEPPQDLEGFVAMPNGYLVGFVGRRLVFSEPYRPHAWPAEYELATEFEIVGLGVWDSTLVVGTKSQVYVGQGVSPASFTLTKIGGVEPCRSRSGMVSTAAGVYFPSLNGLTVVNASGVQTITRDVMTKDEWNQFEPSSLYATQLGLQYIGFYNRSTGIIFDPLEPSARLTNLRAFDNVDNVGTDSYTGNVFLLRDNRVWDWDAAGTAQLFWRWVSKEFHLPEPVNFGACKVKFSGAAFDLTEDVGAYYAAYNAARFAAGPLSTLGGAPLGSGVQGAGLVPGWVEPEISAPLGGSLLYSVAEQSQQAPTVRLIVYANGVKKFDRIIRDESMVRLPEGFKSDIWQFEMIGNTSVFSLQVAETGKELAKV